MAINPTSSRPSAEGRPAQYSLPDTRSVPAEPAPTPPGSGPSRAHRWRTLAVLCVPLLVISLDNTVLNVALPTLVRRLHASDSELQWIVDAYALVFGGTLLVSGSLADRIGRKHTFCAGLAIFAVCSLWAGFSGSSGLLIAARASMGIGAALIMPATVSIITDTFTDPAQRQRALGIWAAATGAGVALGPIVGGVLLTHFAWGSVFLINVPIAAAGLALAIPFIPNSRNPHAARPDAAGAAVSVAGLGLLLWAVIEAPLDGWTSAAVIGLGGGGLLVLAAFLALETRSAHPMLKLEFFRERSFSIPIAAGGVLMFALLGALFVLTQFLQFQLGYGPLQAGIRMLPAAGGILLVAPLSPAFIRRVGTKGTVAAGLLLAAAGLWQISGSSVTTTYLGQLPGSIMLGLGTGCVMPACIGAIMATVPRDHTAIGSATNSTFAQIGGALGVAVLGSLLSTRYQHLMTRAMAGHSVPPQIQRTILGSLGAALGVAERVGGNTGMSLAAAAHAAFISGMVLATRAGAGVALGGTALALLALPFRPTIKGRRASTRTPHRRQAPAACVAASLLALVVGDLASSPVRAWWGERSVTGSIVSSLLIVAATALILDAVIERRKRRDRATSVAVQAVIVYTQALRAADRIDSTARREDLDARDAREHLRTLATMLLTASPNLFDDADARPFLEDAQRLTGWMWRTISDLHDAQRTNEDRRRIATEMARLRASAAPLLQRLPIQYRSILREQQAP